MDFVSFEFYVFLAVVVIAYYIVPLRFRWYVLLAASLYYYAVVTTYSHELFVFLGIIAISWLFGLLHEKLKMMDQNAAGASQAKTSAQETATSDTQSSETGTASGTPSDESGSGASGKAGWTQHLPLIRKLVLAASVLLMLGLLFLAKYPAYLYTAEYLLHLNHLGILITVGVSFFIMQIIAYLVDVYRGKVHAQRNPLKYALFVSFFPQIIQGPIPRYEQLGPQLTQGHKFDEDGFVKGFMLIIWGFFLKLMIADKAGIVVDALFESYKAYQGSYALVAGILYSIQLYADFLACVTLAQGMSELLGIHLADNFRRPYFATSIKEFWNRWHLSLSTWLRDYVYIPLGGNRKGKLRKYINLCLTFLVSGMWHGNGVKYIFWGLMHAGYQILGALTERIRDKLYCLVGLTKGRKVRVWISRAFTFFFVMLAWIVFRAETLEQGLFMVKSIFTVYNPWIFFNDSLLEFGLDWKESMILIFSVMTLIWVSVKQEAGFQLRDAVLRQPLFVRWAIYLTAIAVIIVFGSYGYGFDAADFIYGNF